MRTNSSLAIGIAALCSECLEVDGADHRAVGRRHVTALILGEVTVGITVRIAKDLTAGGQHPRLLGAASGAQQDLVHLVAPHDFVAAYLDVVGIPRVHDVSAPEKFFMYSVDIAHSVGLSLLSLGIQRVKVSTGAPSV